jgi:transposase
MKVSIGVDPHKASHAAVAIDGDETQLCELKVRAAIKGRIKVAVAASNTSLLEVYGVGPVVAALIIGHSGDVTRFASHHHFASYNGTAPIEASSGPKKRHRLNTRGNRTLNHALHMIAICQIRYDTPGAGLLPPQNRRRQEAARKPSGR